MLFSNTAAAGDAFEVVSMQFIDGVSPEEQKKLMQQLDAIVSQYEGFKSRDYYYSREDDRWVDFLVWSDETLARQASEKIIRNPRAGAIFSRIDENSMSFSHYTHLGGTAD